MFTYKIMGCTIKSFSGTSVCADALEYEYTPEFYKPGTRGCTPFEFSSIAELKNFVEEKMSSAIKCDELCNWFLDSAEIRAPFKNKKCGAHERKTGFLLKETSPNGVHHVKMYSFTVKQIAH